MPTVTVPSAFLRRYSCSFVYSRSAGTLATGRLLLGRRPRAGAQLWGWFGGESRCGPGGGQGSVALPRLLARERGPHVVGATLELRARADVVDHEVGARALELRRHLRRDHLHRLGLLQAAVAHEALEAQLARRVDEHDAVELLGLAALEQQRDVAHHDLVAPLARLGDLAVAESQYLGMDDAIELLELELVAEQLLPQHAAVDHAVRREHVVAPAPHDLRVGRHPRLDDAAREHVRVDDRRPELGEPPDDGGLAGGNVAGEADEKHGEVSGPACRADIGVRAWSGIRR